MQDLISRQAAITLPVIPKEYREYQTSNLDDAYEQGWNDLQKCIEELPSAQPEQPPYVAEIEAEYQKAVKMPYIHKPLAKALYEVWKKHDREDAERKTDG